MGLGKRYIGELKALAVRVAIDGFGTGYSSLAHLREPPTDALKIDRSLVAGIASSRSPRSLASMLVGLGTTLEIETFAEGIEDEAQIEVLIRDGCRFGQGYLFARPLEPHATTALLTRSPTLAPS